MVRGRRPRVSPPPTRTERVDKVRGAILGLRDDLIADGFGSMLPPPATVVPISAAIHDAKTGGWIAHVEEPLGIYLQRVSIQDNFLQRPPFDHSSDPIYRRLIRDFISGAAMPESKVAALSRTIQGGRAESLDVADLYYSIIDGLQRGYCYGLAVLLVWRREQLVRDGLLSQEAWSYIEDTVEKAGEPRQAVEELLRRTMRYEVFWNIDLEGLLHYMVTFNTAQRRMSLDVQLEIMRGPLIRELENAGIPVWHDIASMPGMRQARDRFPASDLILATQAFITNNPQLTPASEAERLLNQSQAYLDNIGDINDVARTLTRLTAELHPEIMRVYAHDPSKRYVLSGGGTFFQSLAAACGYVRNRINMRALEAALDKIMTQVRKPGDDPLHLDDYQRALSTITSSRGKAMRRLVYDTFLRFFTGATLELEWSDTAAQITG